jgi:hypothetical protein
VRKATPTDSGTLVDCEAGDPGGGCRSKACMIGSRAEYATGVKVGDRISLFGD